MKAFHLLLTGTLLWAGITQPAFSAQNSNDDVAIIIGNKAYEDSDIPEVSFALNDARAMRRFAQDVLKIRSENIIYMENATQAKMQSAFGRAGNHRGKAFQYVKPNVSNLYVFYSGHGMPGQHDDKSYLLPVDAEIETADINGYATDTLYENLAQVDAKSVTVFLDACFSGGSHGGALIKRASGARVLPNPVKIQSERDKSSLTVLTAASRDQLASWDEEAEHGLFTEYLLRALYGEADENNDGQVQVAEVGKYLQEDMRYKARRTFNRDQVPTVVGQEDQILVAAIEGKFPERPRDFEKDSPVNTAAYDLTPVEENMFAVKNANVRSEPTVRSVKVDMIPKGEPIHVAAKVTDRPWYAIERGDEIIGYVFADLLGEEKEIATEEENRAIRELKARLEKLERQTILAGQKDLPTPPISTTSEDTLDTSYSSEGVEDTLKSMGAILARQSFIENHPDNQGTTRLHYNWIKVSSAQCRIDASISLRHDSTSSRSIDLHDHHISANLKQDLTARKRVLRNRDEEGRVINEVTLYRYGPFTFNNVQDRREFRKKARQVQSACLVTVELEEAPIIDRPRPASPPGLSNRRLPPPPPFQRRPPPPPRR